MSLDIRFSQMKARVCPHCGKELAEPIVIDSVDSGGSAWYPFLECIGYYVPIEERTEENDWSGKDMVLTKEQAESAYRFVKKQLRGYIFIKARIAKVEERIAELEQEDGVGSLNMDGMPHGSTPGDPVARMAIARATLHEQLARLRADLKEKEREIREYIESVKDEEVKLIIEWRFIDLLDWYEIAGSLEDMTGKYVDRSTPAKKMRRYLQEHEKGA